MDMRRILLMAAAQTSGSLGERLQEQADAVDLSRLRKIMDTMQVRVTILQHAAAVMIDGVRPHPLHAFLHATECIRNEDGSRITDSEFYHVLQTWVKVCEGARTDDVPAASGSASYTHFAERFMKGE